MDEVSVDRFPLHGTWMGGRVAQWIAVDHSRRFSELVLGCTTPGGAHVVERGAEVKRTLGQRDADATRRALMELMCQSTPSWAVLPTITAPTLILHGTDDSLNPADNAQLLADRSRRATAPHSEGTARLLQVPCPRQRLVIGSLEDASL